MNIKYRKVLKLLIEMEEDLRRSRLAVYFFALFLERKKKKRHRNGSDPLVYLLYIIQNTKWSSEVMEVIYVLRRILL